MIAVSGEQLVRPLAREDHFHLGSRRRARARPPGPRSPGRSSRSPLRCRRSDSSDSRHEKRYKPNCRGHPATTPAAMRSSPSTPARPRMSPVASTGLASISSASIIATIRCRAESIAVCSQSGRSPSARVNDSCSGGGACSRISRPAEVIEKSTRRLSTASRLAQPPRRRCPYTHNRAAGRSALTRPDPGTTMSRARTRREGSP